MIAYLVIAAFAAAWIFMLNLMRKERSEFNRTLTPRAQKMFTIQRELADSARRHQRDAKIVMSVLALERAKLDEESRHAPQWPSLTTENEIAFLRGRR